MHKIKVFDTLHLLLAQKVERTFLVDLCDLPRSQLGPNKKTILSFSGASDKQACAACQEVDPDLNPGEGGFNCSEDQSVLLQPAQSERSGALKTTMPVFFKPLLFQRSLLLFC